MLFEICIPIYFTLATILTPWISVHYSYESFARSSSDFLLLKMSPHWEPRFWISYIADLSSLSELDYIIRSSAYANRSSLFIMLASSYDDSKASSNTTLKMKWERELPYETPRPESNVHFPITVCWSMIRLNKMSTMAWSYSFRQRFLRTSCILSLWHYFMLIGDQLAGSAFFSTSTSIE